MNKIEWSEDASSDLIEIITYIKEKDGKDIAFKIYERIINKVECLIEFPKQGRAVPELSTIGIFDFHEIIEVPWRIIYQIINKTVFITTIIDSRRNIEDILYKKVIDGIM